MTRARYPRHPGRLATVGGGFGVLILHLLAACGETVEVGFDDELASSAGMANSGGALAQGGEGSASGGGGRAGAAGAVGAETCTPTPCRGKTYACGNCEDDERDGSVDASDADCLGPCDDDEGSLGTGLRFTQTGNCGLECYFDGDNGSGNDKCRWNHACDPLSVAPDFPPSSDERCAYDAGTQVMGASCAELTAEQPASCLENCVPLVPNGCDCFGCCEVPGAGGEARFIGAAGCLLDAVDDAQRCPPCTQVASCKNPCGECETCVGRPAPAECSPDAACPVGQAACTTDAPCDFGEYCVTGCCVRAPEPT